MKFRPLEGFRESEKVRGHSYELKRCPFCASCCVELIYQPKAFFVSCQTCRARGEKVWVDVKGMDAEARDAAVAVWNRRIPAMVRRPVVSDEKRTRKLTIRLTEDEWLALTMAKQHLGASKQELLIRALGQVFGADEWWRAQIWNDD